MNYLNNRKGHLKTKYTWRLNDVASNHELLQGENKTSYFSIMKVAMATTITLIDDLCCLVTQLFCWSQPSSYRTYWSVRGNSCQSFSWNIRAWVVYPSPEKLRLFIINLQAPMSRQLNWTMMAEEWCEVSSYKNKLLNNRWFTILQLGVAAINCLALSPAIAAVFLGNHNDGLLPPWEKWNYY